MKPSGLLSATCTTLFLFMLQFLCVRYQEQGCVLFSRTLPLAIAGGGLTGKYGGDTPPEGARFVIFPGA